MTKEVKILRDAIHDIGVENNRITLDGDANHVPSPTDEINTIIQMATREADKVRDDN